MATFSRPGDKLLRYASATAFAEAIEELIRRRRLQVGPARLAAFIDRLGLTEGPDVDGAASDPSPSRPDTAVLAVDEAELRSHAHGERGEETSPGASHDVAPQIYRVQREGGRPSEPMSYPRVIELFATGEIGSRTPIAREAGPFNPALHFKEFARFVTSPALRWDDDPESAEQTKLEATLPAYMFSSRWARTGAGPAERTRRKKIYLVEERPSSSRRPTSASSRRAPVASGQVLRMEVEMALAMLPKFGGGWGRARRAGVLRPIELFRAIHEQMQLRYTEVLSWPAGADMCFVRGARSHEETFPLGMDPYELIARGIREGYAAAELRELLGPVLDDVLERVPHPPVRVETFRLPEREAYVLRKVDGSGALRALIGQVGNLKIADADDVMRAVFVGLSCEVLRSIRWNALHPESGVRRAGGAQVRLGPRG